MKCTFSGFCFSLQIYDKVLCSLIRFSKSLRKVNKMFIVFDIRKYPEQFNKIFIFFKNFLIFWVTFDNLLR